MQQTNNAEWITGKDHFYQTRLWISTDSWWFLVKKCFLNSLSYSDGTEYTQWGRRMKFLCIIVLLECVRQCVPMGPEPAQEILWIGFLLHTHQNITLTEHCYCNNIILSSWRLDELHSTVNWISCIDIHKKIRSYSTKNSFNIIKQGFLKAFQVSFWSSQLAIQKFGYVFE